jgi:hypothetical protein
MVFIMLYLKLRKDHFPGYKIEGITLYQISGLSADSRQTINMLAVMSK